MSKNITHKITTTDKVDVKKATLNDDYMVTVEDEEEAIDIRDFFKPFIGKSLSFSVSEKTESEIDDDYSDENVTDEE